MTSAIGSQELKPSEKESGCSERMTRGRAALKGQRRHEMKLSGYIQKYFSDRGFGFIVEHKNLHFFHITSCSFIPEVGQQVTFGIVAGRKGPAAVDVDLASGPTTPIASSEVSK